MGENINIKELLDALRRRFKMIIIITLIFVLVSAIFTFFLIKPQYEASTKLFIGKEEIVGKPNTYDNNEELKLKILNAIKDNEIARS
ncbi:MAG: Wzz/FepE/Etk N-terminal domain-containing protein, partial [Clostridia bacterium]